jgi:WD40 repeat protein
LYDHSYISQAIFAPDGRSVVTSGYYMEFPETFQIHHEVVRLWGLDPGISDRKLADYQSGVEGWCCSVAYSPDSKRVVIGDRSVNNGASVFVVETGAVIQNLSSHFADAVAYSPDGQFIVTSTGGYGSELWNAVTGRLVRSFLYPAINPRGGDAVAFSPDGTKVLIDGDDGTARLWWTAGICGVKQWGYYE